MTQLFKIIHRTEWFLKKIPDFWCFAVFCSFCSHVSIFSTFFHFFSTTFHNLFAGSQDVVGECAANGNQNGANSQCQIDLCIADGTFTLNLFALMFQLGGINQNTPPYDPSVTHAANTDNPGTFDPAVECLTNALNGAGRSEKACCGSYPNRYPFKTFNGEKDCCGDRTFTTLALQCCFDTDVIDINDSC